jgi:hypothetical protein
VALALAGILLLQIVLAWGRMGGPFLDGRIHYNYDNAAFSFQARTGIVVGGPRSQLGLTSIPFASWGKPSGSATYYTHHPFLFKALLQLWIRLLGDRERSSRSFALTVSMVAAAGTLVALAIATGSAAAAALGTAMMVATPVFAVHQVCIKYEVEGMAIGAWLLAAIFVHLRKPAVGALAAIAVLAFLAPLAHWTSLFLSLCAIAWLAGEWLVDRSSGNGKRLVALIAGTGLGVTVLFLTFAWLKGGWAPYWRDQVSAIAFRRDTAALPPGAWSEAQRRYLALNFTTFLPWIVALAAVVQAAVWTRERISQPRSRRPANRSRRPIVERALPAFFVGTLITACVWQFGFPQSSYIHLYTQLWFVLPLAAGTAALFGSARRGWAKYGVAVATGLVIVFLSATSVDVARRVLAAQQGTPDDIRFLRSLRESTFRRLVYVPLVREPPSHWFDGPIGPYYTDRSITTYDGVMPLGNDDQILVQRDDDRGEVLARLEAWAGIVLENETCGGHLCAYGVRRR